MKTKKLLFLVIFAVFVFAGAPGFGNGVAAQTVEEHKILIIPVNFENHPEEPYTKEQLREMVFGATGSISAFYKEASYGKVNFSGDIFDWVTVPDNNDVCDDNLISIVKNNALTGGYRGMAFNLMRDSGFDYSSYDYFMFVVAPFDNCHWIGTGGQNGVIDNYGVNKSYRSITVYPYLQTMAHEIGHTFGLGESHFYTCGSKQIDVSAKCAAKTYDNIYTPMGSSAYLYNFGALEKKNLDWLSDSLVMSANASGYYTIYTQETNASNPQLLAINKSDTGFKYYFEYRQPYGFDAILPPAITAGVSAFVDGMKGNDGTNYYGDYRLDLTPGSAGGVKDSALADGKSFVDQINGFTVTQVSHNSDSATVYVNYAPNSCVKIAPSVSFNANQIGSAGTAKTYSVTVTNNDTAACPSATTFNLSKTVPLGWNSFLGSTSVVLNPQASATFNFTLTPPLSAVAGVHQFTIGAVDAASSQHKGNGGGTYTIYADTVAPMVKIVSPINNSLVTRVPSRSFTSEVTATDDNSGVERVEFYINSESLKSYNVDYSAPYSFSVSADRSSFTKGAKLTLTARAYDKAGNVSSDAIKVTIADDVDSASPTISVKSPLNGEIFYQGQQLNFSAAAADNTGVKYVNFYLDGVFKWKDTTAPYTYPIYAADTKKLALGKHTLYADTIDSWIKSATASTVNFTINSIVDTTPPTISFVTPQNNANYTLPQAVLVTMAAEDNLGISKVYVYDGDNLVALFNELPYKTQWTILPAADNGAHLLRAVAYDAAGNTAIATINLNVNLNGVADTTKPAISLTAPIVTTYASAQTVIVSAAASDNIGVSKVEFYDGANLLGIDSTSPYGYDWAVTAANNGTHFLTAKAYDAAGNSAVSTAVLVMVNIVTSDIANPMVSITAPTPITYRGAQVVAINTTASDNIGVSKVEFYDGANLLGVDATSPYSYSWEITAANNGTHFLTAKAYDAAGNSAVSTAVSVTVNIAIADTTKPTVSITAPTANSTISGIANINAAAGDNSGVAKVEFYVDGTLKATDSTSPYSYSWNTAAVTNGTHSLIAKAYDVAGNNTTSTTVSVTVNNTVAGVGTPVVTITSPGNNTNVGGTVSIGGTATDDKGVTKVELYIDGNIKTTIVKPVYTLWKIYYSWNTSGLAKGFHTITAKAYDADGNIGTSAPVTVIVR